MFDLFTTLQMCFPCKQYDIRDRSLSSLIIWFRVWFLKGIYEKYILQYVNYLKNINYFEESVSKIVRVSFVYKNCVHVVFYFFSTCSWYNLSFLLSRWNEKMGRYVTTKGGTSRQVMLLSAMPMRWSFKTSNISYLPTISLSNTRSEKVINVLITWPS